MKTMFMILAVLPFITCNLVSLSSQCDEKSVPDINQMCIQPDYIQGCTLYKNIKECATCKQEYTLQAGKCELNEGETSSEEIVGCLQASAGQCKNCANGFIQSKGKCIVGIKNCQIYNSDLTCQTCNREYSLILNQCKHNNLLGCKTQLSDHNCQECFSPFQLTSYQCSISNCKSLNDFGCVACECGYYLTESRTCQKIPQGCLKNVRGACVECLPHYKLKGGVCVIEGCQSYIGSDCQSCSENYVLVNGTCKFSNCYNWYQEQCLICNQGYNLVNGKCQPADPKFVCEG